MPSTTQEQLKAYLADAHSIEEQAIPQMQAAPRMAGDPQLASAFREHLTETEGHERLMRERLDALGASPSKVKDLAGRATGIGFALFARFQPDTPGKLVAHAFSYEHLELAAYELLVRMAERAGDGETAEAARRVREEERAMIERLQASFERAAEAALREVEPDDLNEQLVKYLADAHAIEAQAIQLLKKSPDIAGNAVLANLYEEHLEETRRHEELVNERLAAHGAGPSRLKDAALRAGALNWGMFFQAQPDTPAKLAGFAFAFEHLEIGGYEQLRHVARRAGDDETIEVVGRILTEEYATADRLADEFDRALDASLEAQGVTA